MGVDRRLAAVEFFPDRREVRVAQPLVLVAGHAADAIDLERIERVGDLLEALVDVRQWKHRPGTEPPGMIALHLLCELIRLASDPDRDFFAERSHLGSRWRRHRCRDASLVHVLDGLLDRPVLQRKVTAPDHFHCPEPARRHDMVMHVDAMRLGLGKHCGRKAGRGAECDGRGAAREKRTAAHLRGGERLRAAVAQSRQTTLGQLQHDDLPVPALTAGRLRSRRGGCLVKGLRG
jgi:hypothetical protein